MSDDKDFTLDEIDRWVDREISLLKTKEAAILRVDREQRFIKMIIERGPIVYPNAFRAHQILTLTAIKKYELNHSENS
jgi:hypothetical protein